MATSNTYDAYIEKHASAIREMLKAFQCQPVILVGSGLTKRYAGGPSWLELLQDIAHLIGLDAEQFNFLSQRADNKPARIGTELIDPVHKWAWSVGKNSFPKAYFQAGVERSAFLKYLVADRLKKLNPPQVRGH